MKKLKKIKKQLMDRLTKIYQKAAKIFCFAADKILRHLPLRKIVLLESYPDFTDNTMALYRYLVEKRRSCGYRLVWITEQPQEAPHGSTCVNKKGGLRERQKWFVLQRTAKVFVSCNRFFLTTLRSGQVSLFLTHGSPLKASPGYSYFNRFDYVLSQSAWLTPYVAEENGTDIQRLVTLGIPRNDDLYHPGQALSKLNLLGYQKVIAWLPTYRQHRNGNRHDMKVSSFGIPLLTSEEDVVRLNAKLSEKNTLLVLKPHPAQDLRVVRALSVSNIFFLDDVMLKRKGVPLYAFLGAADAMLTDYSSVYYDYLLCDKPIGLTLDDYDLYKSKRGFVYQDPDMVLKGYRLYTVDDLFQFIDGLANSEHPYREEQQKICQLTNDFQDDGASQRVGEFVIQLLQGKRSAV